MAFSTPDSTRFRMSPRLRIVAKIRGFTDQESEIYTPHSKPWVTVSRPKETDYDSSAKVTISFGDEGTSRKDRYEVDNVYEQDENNATVFSREVKPLISAVLNGRNASIIAYGARGSGKTHTIQGSVEKQGLAAMAIAEILLQIKGTKKAVFVSFFEVFQDHVYDLLDPDHPEVQVLEDSQGKIKLKGLSKTAVDSISSFHDLSTCWAAPCYSVQKTPLQLPKRSHKGLMVHIVSAEDTQAGNIPNVMNFVDLAGYEDSRRSSKDGITLAESTRINKSLYAIMNVVYALNTNEKRVPYRESKLTRMLQESLGGSNHVLLLTCLNPVPCQDTICAVSLASRSCQNAGQISTSSTMKSKKHTNQQVQLVDTPISSTMKSKKHTNQQVRLVDTPISSTMKSKKHTNQQVRHVDTPLSAKKNNSGCDLVGRRLFTERKKRIISKQTSQDKSNSDDNSGALMSVENTSQDKSNSEDNSGALMSVDNVIPNAFKETISASKIEKDASQPTQANVLKVIPEVHCDIKQIITSGDTDVADIGKENGDVNIDGERSPPLSERLRELANSLRMLESSTPSHILMPKHEGSLELCGDTTEPKTPEVKTDGRTSERKLEIAKYTSPWERLSGVKNCLVQEFLNFLNSASKEELTRIQGIGEKRTAYILELREELSEPFKTLEDLKEVGLSAKEVNGLMRRMAGQLFL